MNGFSRFSEALGIMMQNVPLMLKHLDNQDLIKLRLSGAFKEDWFRIQSIEDIENLIVNRWGFFKYESDSEIKEIIAKNKLNVCSLFRKSLKAKCPLTKVLQRSYPKCHIITAYREFNKPAYSKLVEIFNYALGLTNNIQGWTEKVKLFNNTIENKNLTTFLLNSCLFFSDTNERFDTVLAFIMSFEELHPNELSYNIFCSDFENQHKQYHYTNWLINSDSQNLNVFCVLTCLSKIDDEGRRNRLLANFLNSDVFNESTENIYSFFWTNRDKNSLQILETLILNRSLTTDILFDIYMSVFNYKDYPKEIFKEVMELWEPEYFLFEYEENYLKNFIEYFYEYIDKDAISEICFDIENKSSAEIINKKNILRFMVENEN